MTALLLKKRGMEKKKRREKKEAFFISKNRHNRHTVIALVKSGFQHDGFDDGSYDGSFGCSNSL
jgi:hypothetical protein